MSQYEREMKDRAKKVAQRINERISDWLRYSYQRRFMILVFIDAGKRNFRVIVSGSAGERRDYDIHAQGLVCTSDFQDLVVIELRAMLRSSGWDAKPAQSDMGVALNWPPNLLQRMYRQLMALLEIKVKATATPPYITMLECTLIPATEQNGGEDVGGVVQFPPKVLR